MSDCHYWPGQCVRDHLEGKIIRLEAEIERLRAALQDMIEISQRNSEAGLMLIAIRKCAAHALEGK